MSEFPLHILIAEAGVGTALARRGALRNRRGIVGLILALIAWLGLLGARRDATRSPQQLDDSLRLALGDAYQARPPAGDGSDDKLSLRELWFPRFTERKRYLLHEDLSYGDGGIRNNLDIWRRKDLPRDARAPVLLQIHGSAWVKGSKRGQGYPLLAHMAEKGWVCVAINYSLAPAARWPAHIIDVKRAIAWVKREIAYYGGDPDFIAVTGGSAGGHLTALAALSGNDPVFQPGFETADTSVQAGIPLYGVYDLLDRAGDSPAEQEEFLRRIVIGASLQDAYDVWDKGSPLSWVNEDAPPLFVIHGGIDTFTNPEQARAFVAALRRVSRNPVAYAELSGAQHAFDWLPSIRTRATVVAIDHFLTHVRQVPSASRAPMY
ncbi:alpha/beta hydrolase [Mycobacterium vicinigordonae]|uniref:Alpha/beta hydrolase n=1 Tax=Mycobacterium vicinigordonae TaxID=1719132 RepID=A0A7D6E517_9MYCO|nr:alpha/beta hydrolase [Mycobacterium vicinigordonae]QLL09841.1 alpha/beta hydrolase [Mycobacterium vicinigordonae]